MKMDHKSFCLNTDYWLNDWFIIWLMNRLIDLPILYAESGSWDVYFITIYALQFWYGINCCYYLHIWQWTFPRGRGTGITRPVLKLRSYQNEVSYRYHYYGLVFISCGHLKLRHRYRRTVLIHLLMLFWWPTFTQIYPYVYILKKMFSRAL